MSDLIHYAAVKLLPFGEVSWKLIQTQKTDKDEEGRQQEIKP